ncbi:hypothetical protein FJM67_07630 [Maribrevibacterium harenarium]|uniref:Uncharacterized protein n=1 Tax=Maribrevibacterium harenarium TaxID=2589817 RepID=A0A501WV66_9GAMM|nr:hypothetical protein [Maribrevibacterium harenarium]TPE52300.1 hypothetical protein FJM67_07630 [Maribrevibacterium harenarium]
MRKDDDVEIPSLSLDQDEVLARQTAKQGAPKRKLNPPPARPAPTKPAPSVQKRQSLFGVYFLIVVLSVAAGGAGFWLWQQNLLLTAELAAARNEIKDLGHQLIAADVSVGEIGDTVEETLKLHDSEIRKLWGVANDRNRKAIKEINDKLAAVEEKLSAVRESVSTQGKLVAIQGDAFNEIEAAYQRLLESSKLLETQAAEQAQQLSAIQGRQEILDTQAQGVQVALGQKDQQFAQLQSAVAAVREQTVALEAANQTLVKDVDGLKVAASKPAVAANNGATSEQVAELTDAVVSMDSFRAQVLQDIDVLKRQVNQLFLDQSLGQ